MTATWAALLNRPDAAPPRRALLLGGARSGKSRLAEALVRDVAARRGAAARYIATAEALDDEMRARIATHRDRRGPGWTTAEVPLDLPRALRDAGDRPVLVDCLTLWLSNLMLAGRDPGAATDAVLAALARHPGPVALVSNEVGLGLVPETPLGRAFRDAQGVLNQRVAAAADCVVFVAAGLPLVLKAP